MKKLERELTMRSDELQKVNLEKDESLEVRIRKYFLLDLCFQFLVFFKYFQIFNDLVRLQLFEVL